MCKSTRQALALLTASEYISYFLWYTEEPKTLKTAWQYYNEGTYLAES